MEERLEQIVEELDSIDFFLEQVTELKGAIHLQVPIGTILVKHPLASTILLDLISEKLDEIVVEANKRKGQLESLKRVQERKQK